MFNSLASSNAQLKAGRVKALAVSSPRRSPFIQEVRSFAESGMPALRNFDVSVWAGLFGPAKLPVTGVQRLNSEVAKLLRSPDFRAQLSAQYARQRPGYA